MPSMPSDLMRDGCASSPTTTVIGGRAEQALRPPRPSRRAASTAWRAAARAVKFAMVAPVTNAPPHPAGSPSTSSSQRRETSSRTAAIGVATKSPAFWSHAAASQLAASAAGSEPPITKPKNRGPAIAMVAGEPTSSSMRMTSSGAVEASGSGS